MKAAAMKKGAALSQNVGAAAGAETTGGKPTQGKDALNANVDLAAKELKKNGSFTALGFLNMKSFATSQLVR